jgi:hypothetical protein
MSLVILLFRRGLRGFLSAYGERGYQPMSAARVESLACTVDDEGNEDPAPDELVAAMVAFEKRYGGLDTHLPGPSYGWAFTAIFDGGMTWPVDVLQDGRTAMAMPHAPYRIINSTVEQRLESHALAAAVMTWPHRVLTATAVPFAVPAVTQELLPPKVAEATGPTDLWWLDDQTAVHLRLSIWWGDRRSTDTGTHHDAWTIRCFARDPRTLDQTAESVQASISGLSASEEIWCSLFSRLMSPGQSCPPGER